MVIAGYPCISRTTLFGYFNTFISTGNPVDTAGTMTTVCHWVDWSESFTLKFKIFRINGSNYELIHSTGWLTHNVAGSQSYTVDWAVEVGDLLAVTLDNSAYSGAKATSGIGGIDTKGGDVTTTTAISTWTSENYAMSLYGTGVDYTDFHVKASGGSDSNSGTSWANAWATVNKGMTDVPANKTLHVGFGTYSSEPANNSLSPDAANVTVVYETATTGGGTGTATVEVN